MSLELEFENEMARIRMLNFSLDTIFGPISLEEPLIGVGDLPQDVQAGVESDRDTGIGTRDHENAKLTYDPCCRCSQPGEDTCPFCKKFYCYNHLELHECVQEQIPGGY